MKRCVTIAMVVLATAAGSARASVLSEAAARLGPGQSIKLNTSLPGSMIYTAPGGLGSNLAYGSSGCWHPTRREVRWIGGQHGGDGYEDFLVYDETSNSWSWSNIPINASVHGYDHNACDESGNHFFMFNPSDAIRKWDGNGWTRLPDMLSTSTQTAIGLCWFPGLGLVRTDNRSTEYYANGRWNGVTGAPGDIGYHAICEYEATSNVAVIGSGNNHNLYKLGADAVVRPITESINVGAGEFQGLISGDPGVQDHFVAYSRSDGRWAQYDVSEDRWSSLSQSSGDGSSPQNGTPNLGYPSPPRHQAIAIPIPTYNVIMYVQNNGQSSDASVWLYRHSASEGPIDDTPPSVPQSLTATTVSSTEVSLSWSASTDDTAVAGYRVRRDGVEVASTTSTTWNDGGLTPSSTYTYTVRAFDTAGNTSADSNTASATTDDAAPTIEQQPSDRTVWTGQVAEFRVVAVGSPPLQYQWRRGGVDIAGANGATYRTDPTTLADDGAVFTCVVTNGIGQDVSDPATLTVNEAGPRVVDGIVALYEFNEGAGDTVADTGGFGDPLDLRIETPSATAWVDGGLSVIQATRVATDGAASKITDEIRSSGAMTLEAWVVPGDLGLNGPARIVTLSGSSSVRNVTLGQGVYGGASDTYDVRFRTAATDANGLPSTTAPAGSLVLGLQHVVFVREADGAARLYVDGIERASQTVGGDLSDWDSTFRFGLADEFGDSRPWLGEFHLVAVYRRALTAAEVEQNFVAGPEGVTSGGGGSSTVAPYDLTATPEREGRVVLRWQPPTEAGAGTTYRVYRNGAQIGETPETSYVDGQIVAGTTYDYQVGAIDASGTETGRSNVDRTATFPPAPTLGLTGDSSNAGN